jgi:MFS transporter, FSR family, fosmidomycin resistance protein
MIRRYLHALHIFNDGFLASIVLFLPFIAKDLGLNLTQAGFLGTLVNSLAIILALPAGYLAAKFGGFKVLIGAAFLYALGFIGIGFSTTYYWLFPMFLLAGVGFALFHPIGFALISRLSKKEERGTAMGNFTALGEVGRVGLSVALTFLIVYLGWHYTAMLYGALAFAIAAFIALRLRRKKETLAVRGVGKENVSMRMILANKKFILASIANLFDSLAGTALFIFLPFLLLHRGADPALLGSFTAAYFIGILIGKTVLSRMADRYGSAKIFIAAELFMAVIIVLMAQTTFLPFILICSVILGIFTKGTAPITKTMVSESVEHHGGFEKAFGVNGIVIGTAATSAPVFLGFMADTYGIVAAFFCMAIAAIIAVVPALLFNFVKVPVSQR